jgi:hypothetical protein
VGKDRERRDRAHKRKASEAAKRREDKVKEVKPKAGEEARDLTVVMVFTAIKGNS